MSRRILFSPVGGTDPISENNCRDGSMLHICRFYKPDKVILYMSSEILDHHKTDNRYLLCLDKLGESLGFHMEYEIIERPELVNVQEYDFFYEDFRNIISDIYKTMDDTDELLLNVSSGTPSMKSGLLVIKTLGEFECKLIQVYTPARKMNDHTHKENDIETLWELNEDNDNDCENRCLEVQCPTLSNLKNEEIIKNLIEKYDYEGALQVAETMGKDVTDKYISAIEMGVCRLLFDFAKVDRLAKQCKIDCIPIKDSDKRKYIEYALNLDIKVRKREYADFIRAISPLLTDLFIVVIREKMQIKVFDYCFSDNKGVWKWNKNTLSSTDTGTKMLTIFDSCYKNGFEGGFVKTDHLSNLICSMCSDITVREATKQLRSIEENIRNLAAHEIISVTDEKIKSLTGFSSNEIMTKIKKYFTFANIVVKSDVWDSYDNMNKEIIALI